MIHTLANGLNIFEIDSKNWYATIFWGSLVRYAVPLFFMCSGSLLLNPEKDMTLKKLYTKNLPRILIALFFWATAYELFDLLIAKKMGIFSFELCKKAFDSIIFFDHHFHLYFLHIMIIIYIFLPATKILTKNLDEKTYKYILIVWCIVTVVYPYILLLPFFAPLQGIPRQWVLNFTYGSIGYTMLGDYMHRFSNKKPLFYALIFIFTSIFTSFGVMYFAKYASAYTLILWDGSSPTALLLAYSLFGFIKNSPKLVDKLKFLSIVAKASFCIYLIHDFFNIIFFYLGININSHAFIMIPAMSILNMILSFICYLILRKIPFVKTYLI